MISGISGGMSGMAALNKPNTTDLFSKTDKDGDGKVSKEEFIASRPSDVSETDAASLFDKMDSESSGSLSESQFSEGMEKNKPDESSRNLGNTLSSDVLAAVTQLLQSLNASNDSSSTDETTEASSTSAPSASDMFTKMDTDGDGAVTKEEFMAARPSDVSEEQSSQLYSSIDTESTGSITEEQFTTAMADAPKGPPPSGGAGGPPPSGGSQSASSSEDSTTTYDALDTNEDGTVSMAELLAGVEEKAASENTDDATKQLLSAISEAINSYAQTNSLDLDTISAFKEVA